MTRYTCTELAYFRDKQYLVRVQPMYVPRGPYITEIKERSFLNSEFLFLCIQTLLISAGTSRYSHKHAQLSVQNVKLKQ